MQKSNNEKQKSKNEKQTLSTFDNFSLELLCKLKTSPNSLKNKTSFLMEESYCKFLSEPTILGCRGLDDSITYMVDIIFTTFFPEETIKIISSEFEKFNLKVSSEDKIVYEKFTGNENDLYFFLKKTKFEITISTNLKKGNFAILQIGDGTYALKHSNSQN